MSQFNLLFLIDDDHPTNYYHTIIVKNSMTVKNVKSFLSSREALKYFEEAQNAIPNKEQNKEQSEIPDVIMLDINMPEINAWDFLEAYDKLTLPSKPIIIILSTSRNPKDISKAETNSNIYEFINKPLTVDYLKELNSKLVHS